jgi:hypothetical protein
MVEFALLVYVCVCVCVRVFFRSNDCDTSKLAPGRMGPRSLVLNLLVPL